MLRGAPCDHSVFLPPGQGALPAPQPSAGRAGGSLAGRSDWGAEGRAPDCDDPGLGLLRAVCAHRENGGVWGGVKFTLPRLPRHFACVYSVQTRPPSAVRSRGPLHLPGRPLRHLFALCFQATPIPFGDVRCMCSHEPLSKGTCTVPLRYNSRNKLRRLLFVDFWLLPTARSRLMKRGRVRRCGLAPPPAPVFPIGKQK
jgi:hypothetical protein